MKIEAMETADYNLSNRNIVRDCEGYVERIP